MPMHPHEVRIAVRSAKFGNSTEERLAIEKVDEQVFSRVRTFEHEMVRNAREFIAAADLNDTAADALEDALRNEIRDAADRSATVIDGDFAKRYRALRSDAEKAIARLEAQARQAEFTAARLESPYDEFVRLVRKYPVVRPTITF